MAGAWLALGSALTGGISDFYGGTTSRRIGTSRFMFATQVIGLVCTVIWVAVSGDAPPHLMTLLAAAAAGVALSLGLGFFLQGLVVGTMSIVAPVSATGVVVPVVAGIAQGNRPVGIQLAGIVVAMVGIVLVSRSPQDDSALARESGLKLALMSAAGIGVFFWLMATASRHDVAWALLITRVVPVVGFAAVLRFQGERLLPLVGREAVTVTTVAALLGFVSMAMYAFATRHGQLAIVSVLASLFPAVPVVLAYVLLRERIFRVQQFGVVAVLAAVVMIASG
jgi:drug/metabolite transporter (DMT)-like permease